MNSKIVKLKDTPVVIGLEWELLDSAVSERKAIRETLKRNPGVKAGVLVRSADIAILGILPQGQKKPSAPSGAALLALANQEAQARATGQSSSIEDNQWIVVERLGEDEYWVVDIKDGVPLPGGDFVGDFDKVRNYMMEMLEGTNFKVFSSDPDVLNLAGHQATAIGRGAESLIAELEKPSRGNLKTLSGVDPTIVFVLIGFVAIVAAFFGWNYYQKVSQERAAAQAAQQRASADAKKVAAEKQGYVDAVQKAVLAALDTGVAAVNSSLQTPSASEVVRAWASIVEEVPISHSGWDTSRVDCAMETPEKPICTVHLQRTPLSINRILLEDYPDVEISADEATYVVRGPDLVTRNADWSLLTNARGLMIGLMSDLQFVRSTGMNYSQGESKDITQAVVLPTPPPSLFKPGDPSQAAAPAPVNTGVGKGQLGLSGKGLWQLRGLGALLDQPGVSISTFTVEMKPEHPWTAQGDFLLRSLPAPVLPAVIGPDGPITVTLPERYKPLISAAPVQGGIAATEGLSAQTPKPSQSEDGPSPAASTVADVPPAEAGPISLGLPEATSGTDTP